MYQKILESNIRHTACPVAATLHFDRQRQDSRMLKSGVFPTRKKDSWRDRIALIAISAYVFRPRVSINDQLSINQRISERKRRIIMVREKYAPQLAIVIMSINLMGVNRPNIMYGRKARTR
jgi:hypothetical protein